MRNAWDFSPHLVIFVKIIAWDVLTIVLICIILMDYLCLYFTDIICFDRCMKDVPSFYLWNFLNVCMAHKMMLSNSMWYFCLILIFKLIFLCIDMYTHTLICFFTFLQLQKFIIIVLKYGLFFYVNIFIGIYF